MKTSSTSTAIFFVITLMCLCLGNEVVAWPRHNPDEPWDPKHYCKFTSFPEYFVRGHHCKEDRICDIACNDKFGDELGLVVVGKCEKQQCACFALCAVPYGHH
ncbi:unnamed protein product [Linum trigynum]|uniref:Uncharacterized protein n=1 Tax=Linum trigynum TaxID=586398 RepID=A0AAV2FFC8_9ROSI